MGPKGNFTKTCCIYKQFLNYRCIERESEKKRRSIVHEILEFHSLLLTRPPCLLHQKGLPLYVLSLSGFNAVKMFNMKHKPFRIRGLFENKNAPTLFSYIVLCVSIGLSR